MLETDACNQINIINNDSMLIGAFPFFSDRHCPLMEEQRNRGWLFASVCSAFFFSSY